MMTRAKLAIGCTLIGIAMVTVMATPLLAHEPTAPGGTPTAGHEAMMQGAETNDAQMAEMMDQCLAMMEMMSMMMGMMGGDMSGMMGGEGMQGMEGMQGAEEMPSVSATPGA